MNSLNITEISDNARFNADVLIDEKFLLLPATLPFSAKMKQAVLEWEFRQVFTDGEEKSTAAPTAVQKATARRVIESETEDVSAEFEIGEPAKKEEPVLDQVEYSNDSESVMQKALRLVNESKTSSTSIENNQLNLVQTVYDEYLRYILEIYTRFVTHKELEYEPIANSVKDLCVFINDHRRYILRVQSPLQDDDRMYLINHALKSTVLAITIAIQLKMPIVKQVELGVSCILHEIGMLRLPPQIYMTNRTLSTQEKNKIYTHPLLSYNILKEKGFPLSVCLGALEHHEKENGMGYPRRLVSSKISIYAKIIAVSCSYEAITASRSHKEARSSYDAMVEMLKNNGKQFDENVIKALLFAVSLYPIGAYVFLHNGKIGQVVDVNPVNPKQPIVQLVGVKDEHGEPVTKQIGTDVRVIRTLSRQEVLDLQKSLN